MALTINGSGINGADDHSMFKGMLSVRGNIKIDNHKTKKPSGAPKSLEYNPGELSRRLVRAKTPQSVANVMALARRKIAQLEKEAASGEYDAKEVENALIHAKRMIECAQLKMHNLREEEMEENRQNQESSVRAGKAAGGIKRRAKSRGRRIGESLQIEAIAKAQAEKVVREELTERKRAHRRKEQKEINEADMDYLKKKIKNLENKEGGQNGEGSGVILSLSAEASMLNEAQIRLEAERAAEMAADSALDLDAGAAAAIGGSLDAGAAVSLSAPTPAVSAVPAAVPDASAAAGGNMDVSL